MGRRRINEIEKEKNREIAEAVQRIVGDRSYKQTGIDAGINPSTVSYICRGKVKPTPDIIVKLTSKDANPQGTIGLEELMLICGYQTDSTARLREYYSFISKNLGTSEKSAKILDRKGDIAHAIALTEKEYGKRTNRIRSIIMDAIISNGYGVKKYSDKRSIIEAKEAPDWEFVLANEEGGIRVWQFFLCLVKPDGERSKEYARFALGSALMCGSFDNDNKISIIVTEEKGFQILSDYSGNIAYRGELSVIYIDIDKGKVVDEIYLSHYDNNDFSKEIFLI